MLDLPPKTDNEKPKVENHNYIEIPKPSCASLNISIEDVRTIFGSLINIVAEKNYTYEEIPCTKEEEDKIYEIIHTMGTHGKLSLLMNYQSRLYQLGDEIEHIYPLKFLGIILSNPTLRKDMQVVMNDYFKRKKFIDQLGAKFDKEMIKGKFQKYLPAFANHVDVPLDYLKPFVAKKDWFGFVKFIANY
jgi:hypothetical protein